MVTIIGSQEVTNFQDWKTGFDSDETARQEAGIKTLNVFNSLENPNEVTFVLEAENKDSVNTFMADADFQERMKKAGVVSVPVIKILNKI